MNLFSTLQLECSVLDISAGILGGSGGRKEEKGGRGGGVET